MSREIKYGEGQYYTPGNRKKNPMASEIKDWNPPKEQENNKPDIGDNGGGPGHQKTVPESMKDAGIDVLKEDSTPEEVSEAVIKFSNMTTPLNPVLRMVARSHLSKKLKDIKITGAGDIVKQVFRVDTAKDDGKGQGVAFDDPQPWTEEVSGADLLEEIRTILKLYTVLPEGADSAISLWILFAWCHDSFYVSPYLVFSSPAKRCGKTTALRIISKLTPRPLMASNISTAALFRSIEHFKPTLILDELDTFLNSNPEINGIINAGHDRDSAFVLRVEGENFEPKQFSVWSPKIFAGIGRRKDTLEDRSVIIPMKRKPPNENVEKIRLDRLDKFKVFRQKAARWADDYGEALGTIDPSVPETLNDRAQDNWRPLMAIAEIAGGEWPKKAREAALLLSGGTDLDDDSISSQLLTDIRMIFKEQGVDRIPSEDLTKCLIGMEDRAWPEYRKGNPISKTGVSRILKPFDIRPKTIRLESGRTPKGYLLDQFKETFLNYLPDMEVSTATPSTSLENKELDDSQTATQPGNVADGKSEIPFKNNNVEPVADGIGGMGEKKENKPNIQETAPLFGAEEDV